MTMFMVLSLWQSHCKSSPGSFDECRMALLKQSSDSMQRDLARVSPAAQ